MPIKGSDLPNAAGCRRSDGGYSARRLKVAGFSMTCQEGDLKRESARSN